MSERDELGFLSIDGMILSFIKMFKETFRKNSQENLENKSEAIFLRNFTFNRIYLDAT